MKLNLTMKNITIVLLFICGDTFVLVDYFINLCTYELVIRVELVYSFPPLISGLKVGLPNLEVSFHKVRKRETKSYIHISNMETC